MRVLIFLGACAVSNVWSPARLDPSAAWAEEPSARNSPAPMGNEVETTLKRKLPAGVRGVQPADQPRNPGESSARLGPRGESSLGAGISIPLDPGQK